jgi:hypothetical protein
MAITLKSKTHKLPVINATAKVAREPKANGWVVETVAQDGAAGILCVTPPKGPAFYTLSLMTDEGKNAYTGKTGLRISAQDAKGNVGLDAELAQAFGRLLASIQ